MLEDYFYLGKITKKFGLSGELVVFLDTDQPQKYYQIQSVFLDIEGEPIPFFIENIKPKSVNQIIVKFEGIDNVLATQYVNTELYLPLSDLPPLTGNNFYYHEIKGFDIVDIEMGLLGKCENVPEYGLQAMFQIPTPQGEILIPIVDDFVINVDREKKTITVKTPPGLIEMNLESPAK